MLPLVRPELTPTDIALALVCLRSAAAQLECELRQYFDAAAVYVVRSARWALVSALKVLGVGSGDEVIVPALCCPSVPNAVLGTGASPAFCDAAGDTIQMAPGSASRLVTERTRAIVALHAFGFPAPVEALKDLCRARDLWLIEDCAPCLGTAVEGRRCGTWGDLTLLSFGMSKPLGTPAGGALVVRSPAAARLVEPAMPVPGHGSTMPAAEILKALAAVVALRRGAYGMVDKTVRRLEQAGGKGLEGFCGGNSAFSSSLAHRQWRRYSATARRRQKNARLLAQSLPHPLGLAAGSLGAEVVPLFLPVRCPSPDAVQQLLNGKGYRTATLSGYGFGPLPCLPEFEGFPGECHHAIQAAKECLLLPLHLPTRQTADMAHALMGGFGQRSGPVARTRDARDD